MILKFNENKEKMNKLLIKTSTKKIWKISKEDKLKVGNLPGMTR